MTSRGWIWGTSPTTIESPAAEDFALVLASFEHAAAATAMTARTIQASDIYQH